MAIMDRFRRGNKAANGQKPPTKEVSRTGSINSGGFIHSVESNLRLTPPNDLDAYREMSRTDSTVRWMLALLKYPILAAEWGYEPPKNATPEELELTAYCEHAVFDELEDGFKEILRKVLKFYDYGHSVFEIKADYRPVEFSYTIRNEETNEKREVQVKREGFVVDRLGERLQRTIAKWNTADKDPAKLESIEQWIGDGRGDYSPTTPAERLIIFTLDKEGDDFRGVSILRSAWRNYQKKLEIENLEAIGIERSLGVPIAYMPGATDEVQDSMETAFKNLRQQENPHIIVPFAKYDPQYQPNGVLIEFDHMAGDGGVDPDPAIKRHEAGMARNILAEFMRLGHEGEGARSTGDVQQDPYWHALDFVVSLVENVLHRELTTKLRDWNYPDTLRLPRLKASKIQAKAVEVIAQALGLLVEKGVILPDTPLEEFARELLDAPEPSRQQGEDPHAAMLDQKLNPPEPPGMEGGQPINPPHAPPPKPGDDKPGDKPKPSKLAAHSERDTIALADYGYELQRPLRPEERTLALADIVQTLDYGETRIENACARLGAAMLVPALKQADQAVEHRSPEAVESISFDHSELADALYGVLRDVYDSGRSEVRGEISRQLPVGMADEKTPPPEIDRVKRLRALADTVASSVSAAAMRALRSLTLRRIEHPEDTPTGPGFDPQQTLEAEAKRAGRPTVGQAFADGRMDEILHNSELIDRTVYSAILDSRGCEACALADGEESPPGGGTPCPNPDCYGGAACRCVRVPVVSALRSGLQPDIGPGYVIE